MPFLSQYISHSIYATKDKCEIYATWDKCVLSDYCNFLCTGPLKPTTYLTKLNKNSLTCRGFCSWSWWSMIYFNAFSPLGVTFWPCFNILRFRRPLASVSLHNAILRRHITDAKGKASVRSGVGEGLLAILRHHLTDAKGCLKRQIWSMVKNARLGMRMGCLFRWYGIS